LHDKGCLKEFYLFSQPFFISVLQYLANRNKGESGDGYIPNILNWSKYNSIVVNADNVSLLGTKNLLIMLGAVPSRKMVIFCVLVEKIYYLDFFYIDDCKKMFSC